jgi:hypothetical protein
MNSPSLPTSRWDRFCLLFMRKPVVWAFMVCTGGATLMMVQGMAESQMPGWPKPPAQPSASGSVAVSSGAVSSAHLEKRTDETERGTAPGVRNDCDRAP